MRYIKAEEILPRKLLVEIQQYVDGTYIYIPRKPENKRVWGNSTTYRAELAQRNRAIRAEHRSGARTAALAEKYHLSVKSIGRILREKDE